MILQQTIQPIGCPVRRMPDTALGAVNHDIAKRIMGKEVGVHFTLRGECPASIQRRGNAGFYRVDSPKRMRQKLCRLSAPARCPEYKLYRSDCYDLGGVARR